MKSEKSSSAFYSLIFIFLGGIGTIGLSINREESVILGLAYFAAFFSYFWIVRFHSESQILFPLGLLIRFILFFSLPSLSDDIYRFLWDGYLSASGLDPFGDTPSMVMQHTTGIIGVDNALFQQLNSPDYFTVYPPLNQIIFWIGVKTGGESWLLATNIIRCVLLAADLLTFYALKKLLTIKGKSPNLSYWYFLNPLVILEMAGNVHFEGLMIMFLILGLGLLEKNKNLFGSLSMGLAIGTKLIPLIFIPTLLFRYDWKKSVLISGISLSVGLMTLLPVFLSKDLQNMGTSLGLYFQHFEFNASFYYLFREIGFMIKGYNIIGTLGPILSIISGAAILLISWFAGQRKWEVSQIWLIILFIYLSFTTTIHPWYVLPLIPLGILSGYYFPIAWSMLIFMSYFGYQITGFELSSFWVVLEYVGLWIFIGFEYYLKTNNIKMGRL
ncbi:glycosyltransferase 87 family protein [Marinoscillum sp. MHG1-6]|uniref:glycosyltransferase 87 family protein n=1 Tax=Marinoscillum sp. MHG1-6 TaxID=2959627 RepID=UPI002157041E|nr:glycosyltransferase 87 family protein [Marinoscillum sp. MHG1-6]